MGAEEGGDVVFYHKGMHRHVPAGAVLGEAVKAVLVLDGVQLSQNEVLAHCRAHLEDYMVPKYVEFRTELPKTGSGKLQRNALA